MYFLKRYYIKKSLWFQRYCLRIPWLFLLNAKNKRHQNSEKTTVKVKHSLIRGAAAVSLAGVDVVRNMGDPLEWVIRLELWTLNDTVISGFFAWIKSTSSDQGGGDSGIWDSLVHLWFPTTPWLTWWSRTKCLAAQLLAGCECTASLCSAGRDVEKRMNGIGMVPENKNVQGLSRWSATCSLTDYHLGFFVGNPLPLYKGFIPWFRCFCTSKWRILAMNSRAFHPSMSHVTAPGTTSHSSRYINSMECFKL